MNKHEIRAITILNCETEKCLQIFSVNTIFIYKVMNTIILRKIILFWDLT